MAQFPVIDQSLRRALIRSQLFGGFLSFGDFASFHFKESCCDTIIVAVLNVAEFVKESEPESVDAIVSCRQADDGRLSVKPHTNAVKPRFT